jgi:hypothetical protein
MHKTRPWDEFHAVKIDLHEVIMGSWVVNVADTDEDYVFLTEHVGSFLKWGYRLINNLNYLNMFFHKPSSYWGSAIQWKPPCGSWLFMLRFQLQRVL